MYETPVVWPFEPPWGRFWDLCAPYLQLLTGPEHRAVQLLKPPEALVPRASAPLVNTMSSTRRLVRSAPTAARGGAPPGAANTALTMIAGVCGCVG